RSLRDTEELPEGVQARIDWVNSLLPEGMRLDTSPILPRTPRSRDFVPELIPKAVRYGDSEYWANDALRASEGRERVQECPSCGNLCDGDGPTVCPDCEDYMAVLDGAVWDLDEGGPDG